jgi:hypothetical protein
MKNLNDEETATVLNAMDTIIKTAGGTTSIKDTLDQMSAQLPADVPGAAEIIKNVQAELASAMAQSFAGMQGKLENIAANPQQYAAEILKNAGVDSNDSNSVQSST